MLLTPLYPVVCPWTSGELSNCANSSRASSLIGRLSPNQTVLLPSISSPPCVTSLKCTLTPLIMLSLPLFQKNDQSRFLSQYREGRCQTARCCPDCCTLCPYLLSFSWEPLLSNQSACSFQQQWCPQGPFFMILAQSGHLEMKLCPCASLLSDSLFHMPPCW